MTVVALISDIHGNGIALDAVLEDLSRWSSDAVVCLGDVLQGGSQPARVAERIQDLGCPVILGNADDFLLTAASAEETKPAHHEVRDWTLDQIGPEGRELIARFQPTVELDEFLLFHGTPRSFDEVILPETSEDVVNDALGGTSARVLAGGHTHLQWCRPVGAATFLNPGSVGLVYNRRAETFALDAVAEYAVVTSEGIIEFCRVQLDPEELAKAALASGRPYAQREADAYLRRAD
jgi:putative phosphoesterase